MAEQFLHCSEISTSIQKMRREGVPQRMGREPRALIDPVEKALHGILNRPHRDPLAAAAEKKRRSIARLANPAQQLVTLRFVVSQRELRVVTNGNDPLFPSLSADFHLLREEVDIHPIDSAKLGEPHPRGVKQLEDRAVSDVL